MSYRPFSVTAKQPANLAVEGAEESLSILPDYTSTVRPPLKHCDVLCPREPLGHSHIREAGQRHYGWSHHGGRF